MNKNFLSKKSWHTGSLKSIEKVWKAEQKKAEDDKRLKELQRELNKERERDEILAAHGSGHKTTQLEWMYRGNSSSVSAEEYLLGKEYKDEKDILKLDSPALLQEEEATEAGQTMDQWSKLMEDPLLAIKKKEIETLSALRKNPVQMKKIKEQLEHMEKKKKKKEKKRKKRERDEEKTEDSTGSKKRKTEKSEGYYNDDRSYRHKERDGNRRSERYDYPEKYSTSRERNEYRADREGTHEVVCYSRSKCGDRVRDNMDGESERSEKDEHSSRGRRDRHERNDRSESRKHDRYHARDSKQDYYKGNSRDKDDEKYGNAHRRRVREDDRIKDNRDMKEREIKGRSRSSIGQDLERNSLGDVTVKLEESDQSNSNRVWMKKNYGLVAPKVGRIEIKKEHQEDREDIEVAAKKRKEEMRRDEMREIERTREELRKKRSYKRASLMTEEERKRRLESMMQDAALNDQRKLSGRLKEKQEEKEYTPESVELKPSFLNQMHKQVYTENDDTVEDRLKRNRARRQGGIDPSFL